MTQTTIEIVAIEEIVGEIETPCDICGFADQSPGVAEWIMHKKCCGNTVLACDPCKEDRVMDRLGVTCVHCGHVWWHAPEAYIYIESLKGES